MLDAAMRKIIDPPLKRLGSLVARTGITANALTLTGLAIGLFAALAIASNAFGLALVAVLLNRLLDGLDGAIARARNNASAFGGYLDIVADFVLWAMLPVGFAFADPSNALAATILLASFIASGTTFLAHAILAAKADEETEARGEKSFFHLGGLAEGTETIAFFVLVLLWPGAFVPLVLIFASLCCLTAIGRIVQTRALFGP